MKLRGIKSSLRSISFSKSAAAKPLGLWQTFPPRYLTDKHQRQTGGDCPALRRAAQPENNLWDDRAFRGTSPAAVRLLTG